MDLDLNIQWTIFQICHDVEIALKRQKVDEYLDKLIDLNTTL